MYDKYHCLTPFMDGGKSRGNMDDFLVKEVGSTEWNIFRQG